MAYAAAPDVAFAGPRITTDALRTHPQGETRAERVDTLGPVTFRDRIAVRGMAA